jgi:signal transduction histidine kinase
MTDNFTIEGEDNAVDAPRTDALRELDELRLEVAELRASRTRLLLAADAERRGIERALHDGLQQQLVGLAADLELASGSVETDPEAAVRHLAQVRSDVREALEEARSLAHRIHPALEAGGLGAALRSAAADAGVRTRIDVDVSTSVAPELAGAVYFCCLHLVEGAAGTAISITVREESEGIAFEIVADREVDAGPSPLRDRVEALGGSLTIRSEPGPRTVWAGFLPVER